MAEARRDQNQVVTLMGVTDDGNLTPVNLVVDPTTGRLKVSAVIAVGTITSINGLSAATQLFAVGTAGDDFNIASLTDTHTFNLPTASATKRGALSSADWTTFNSKAPALGADDNYVTDAEKTKIGYISVTQSVDLDAIETRVNALDAAVVLKGSWDASAGTFPGAGAAQAGDSYIVSVAGTVDGVAFSINDRLLAITDNASTGTYASNWLKLDYTDQVLSVAGRTGAVTLTVADLGDDELSALAGLTSAADKIPYFTGSGTAALADFTAYGRSLVAVANEAAFKTLVNLEANTDFYAPSGTDVAVADGGTGSSTPAAAALALSLMPSTGWVDANEAWSYSSVDGPTGVITVPSDGTTKYSVGMRVRFTQTTVKYGIITAVAATTITIYTGTDYTLANAAITANSFSMVKAPFGFPLDPTKWSVKVSDTSNRAQATPSAGTWYNPGSITISLPIGAWLVRWEACISYTDSGAIAAGVLGTLSTANNSQSDAELTVSVTQVTSSNFGIGSGRSKTLVVAAKTSYYLNVKTDNAGVDNIYLLGAAQTTVINAICAYL